MVYIRLAMGQESPNGYISSSLLQFKEKTTQFIHSTTQHSTYKLIYLIDLTELTMCCVYFLYIVHWHYVITICHKHRLYLGIKVFMITF